MIRGSTRRFVLSTLTAAALAGTLGAGTAHAADTIKVAALLALSGASAQLGSDERRAIEAVVAKTNAEGGIRGQKIELLVRDTKTNPTEAARLANQVLQEKVVAMLTTVGSETLAVADIAARAQVPIFAMVSTPSVTDKNQSFYKWVFRAMSPANADLFITADKIAADKRKRLAIFFIEDAFGQQYSQLMAKSAAERGVEVSTIASAAGDTTDMTPVALKVRNSKPDSVYIAASNMGLVSAFMRKLREVGEPAQIYGQANMINGALFKTAGEASEGLIASTLLNPQVPGKLAPLFELMKNNGGVRGVGEVVGSNAMTAVVSALKAGAVDGPSVREKAETMGPVQGYAAAPFHYTADNHDGWPRETLMLVTVKDGKFVTMDK